MLWRPKKRAKLAESTAQEAAKAKRQKISE